MMYMAQGHIFNDSSKLDVMFEMYRNKMSLKQISRVFECDHSSILYQLKKHGVWAGSPRPRHTISIRYQKTMQGRELAKEINESAHAPSFRLKKVSKYDNLFAEELNPGKSYKEYMADQRIRDQKTAALRQKQMDKLREEKRVRDEMIKAGQLPSPEPHKSFNEYIVV